MEVPVEGVELRVEGDTLVVSSDSPLKVLASAVLGGGFSRVRYIINHHVDRDYRSGEPEKDLERVARDLGIHEPVVGMMTAVPMDKAASESRGAVTAVVTGGVSNAVAAGEEAGGGGTINTIVLVDANLTEAAMVNAVITATEAKTLALGDLGVRSAISGEAATGTSTDAVVIACTGRGPLLRYAGTATGVGREIARATRRAVREAVAGYEGL
ncbi:MAG: adenosylcobinamide amidohydrolase [Euryarchaeota archaeon]|nr:adenosylcobinamide amidohydrolase [Euryarchaeota archaeon]